MGGPLQPQSMQPMQQGGAYQGAKAALPATWSDSSINISLDFLGPGVQPPKQSQPTLNTLQHGETNGRSGMNGDTVANLGKCINFAIASFYIKVFNQFKNVLIFAPKSTTAGSLRITVAGHGAFLLATQYFSAYSERILRL